MIELRNLTNTTDTHTTRPPAVPAFRKLDAAAVLRLDCYRHPQTEVT
jgi:hypothetical protein